MPRLPHLKALRIGAMLTTAHQNSSLDVLKSNVLKRRLIEVLLAFLRAGIVLLNWICVIQAP